jgi:hypothetical protein
MTVPRPIRRSPNQRPNLWCGTPQALCALLLLALCAALPAYAAGLRLPGIFGHSAGAGAQPDLNKGNDLTQDQAEMVENSRDAGLLTDWHFLGRYGHDTADLARPFAPERWFAKRAAKQAVQQASEKQAAGPSGNSHPEKRLKSPRYELIFPEGTFVLPPKQAGRDGVFYALSCTYLTSSGDWNVYLESGADAVLFVDGRRVLARGSKANGTLRQSIHAESGYHMVMVKFVAQAAPFRVAILPPNSGSRRKNNTPYLHRSPASEDLQAEVRRAAR